MMCVLSPFSHLIFGRECDTNERCLLFLTWPVEEPSKFQTRNDSGFGRTFGSAGASRVMVLHRSSPPPPTQTYLGEKEKNGALFACKREIETKLKMGLVTADLFDRIFKWKQRGSKAKKTKVFFLH